jgi:hypothetical protein
MKRRNLIILSLAVLTAAFLAGPRVSVNHQPFSALLPADLDSYLAQTEGLYPDIKVGAEKTILWADPQHQQTDLAIVYLHGFSASRQETAP